MYKLLCGCYVKLIILCVPNSPINIPSSLALRPSLPSGSTAVEWEEKGLERNMVPTAASKTVIKNVWSFTFTLLYACMALYSGEGRALPSFTCVLNTVDFV